MHNKTNSTKNMKQPKTKKNTSINKWDNIGTYAV